MREVLSGMGSDPKLIPGGWIAADDGHWGEGHLGRV